MSYKVSLKAARVNVDLTQSEAATKLNVCKNTIVNWESGKSAPDVNQLLRICEVYKVPFENIFLS